MLNLLIEAMEEVIALDKELYMRHYYKEDEPQEGTTISECGTAACILGYAALKVPEQLWYKLRQDLGYHLAL